MHGKMGIAIYFFHLARKTNNPIYEDYAGELIDEIYDEITIQTPCNFENGLAGIGWGIEYLVQNGFIEADTDEVLEEFDKRLIHEITHHAPDDVGILQGISGYIAYFFKRIKKGSKKNPALKRALLKAILLFQKYIEQNDLDFNELWEEPQKFDITWNYTSVLWILAEITRAGLYKKETEQIINRLLSPLKNNTFLPQLNSHRLLLALAVEKLNQLESGSFSGSFLNELPLQIEIKKEKIQEEVEPNSAFIQHGLSGIALVYKLLFSLTKNQPYKKEALFWKSCCFELPEYDQGYAGYHVKKEDGDKVFGLLNGLAGISLNEMKSVINQITQS
jgi:Lanthionine synthetase C-like protein.